MQKLKETKMIPSKITSFDDVDNVLYKIAQNETVIAKEEASMNEKIQIIKESFDVKTAERRGENELLGQRVEEYCFKNKAEFEKVRSKDLTHGTVGFRNTPPKVLQLSKKYTVTTSLELLKRIFKKAYVRTKEEVNKDAILADYAAKKLTDTKLASVGLKVDQDEKFYLECNWESIEKAA